MSEMSDVKLLSLITRRKVDPEKVEDIKRALFLHDLIDMGATVGFARVENDGEKCSYSDSFKIYEGKGPACKALMKLDESLESIRKRYDKRMIDKMMEFARRAVDKKLNGKREGKTCKHEALSTYGNVYLEGRNEDVCRPFHEAQKLLVEKDREAVTARKIQRGVVKKYLKPVKPEHHKKGKIKLLFNEDAFRMPSWAKSSGRGAKGKDESAK